MTHQKTMSLSEKIAGELKQRGSLKRANLSRREARLTPQARLILCHKLPYQMLLEPKPLQRFLKEAYQVILGRVPDQEGYENYLKASQLGQLSRPNILSSLRFSKEGQRYGRKITGLKRSYYRELLHWKYFKFQARIKQFRLLIEHFIRTPLHYYRKYKN